MEILCPADRAGEIGEILETIGRGERVVHFETERRRKDGTSFPVSVTVSPVYDEHGTLVGASSIARDITEQLQFRSMSELRHRADDLDGPTRIWKRLHIRFPTICALRCGPWAVSATLCLTSTACSRRSRPRLRRADPSAGRSRCRLSSRVCCSSRGSCEPRRISTPWISARRPRGSPRTCSVVAQDRSGAPYVIQRPVQAWADHALIRTVLRNLLGNAWKFTSHRVQASIEFGTTPTGDATVCCYIRDDGAGFDSDYADQLFQPFRRSLGR